MCYVNNGVEMNEKKRRNLEKVHRWIPLVVYICASVGIIWNSRIYAYNDIEVATYFASAVSIMIIYLISIFICDRLYKLERGKNGS